MMNLAREKILYLIDNGNGLSMAKGLLCLWGMTWMTIHHRDRANLRMPW